MKEVNENKQEAAFEADLYQSLKFYGYLFPENIGEIRAFEQSHDDNLETPLFRNILEDGKDVDNIDLDLGLAAYSDTEQEFPKLSDSEKTDDPKKTE